MITSDLGESIKVNSVFDQYYDYLLHGEHTRALNPGGGGVWRAAHSSQV